MKSLPRISLFALLIVLLSAVHVFGQATASGTIEGTVTDNSQAVVVGAQAVAVNKGTGASRSATTDGTGSYRFELLPAGSYVVTVTKSGFAKQVQNVELVVGQTASVNAQLKPGAASEVVEVSAEAAIIDTTKTSVGQNITPSEVQDLPLLSRDVANLAYLVPGVKAADSYDPTKNRYAIISVNGQDGRNINVTVNGVDNKDNTVGGPVMQLPLEAVQEFSISTQRFSAANGRSEGAAINMITKTGTNNYHGSAFGFFRDEALNAIDTFSAQGGGEKPPYSRQFFGGSVGGPFIKNKMFGFFAFERQREHTSKPESPTAFQELSLVTDLGAQPAANIPTPFFENRYNGRLDYRFSDRETAYISYSSQANNSENDQSDGQGDLTGGNFTLNHLQVANFTLNSVLTNSLVNSFTFGFQYWNNLIDSHTSAPYITFAGGEWFGTNVNVPQQSYQRKFQFRDDITKTYGKHTLKAGVDYIYTPTLGGFFEFNSTLEIDFGSDPSKILGDTTKYPDGFATAGLVTGMTVAEGEPHFNMPGGVKQLGLYFQDDWKVTNRLTLNLGLRWDKDFNLVGASAIANSRSFQEMQAIGSPLARLAHDDNKDFSPRIGFAYDLTGSGKHVVRGGYGLYYDNIFENIPLFLIQQANPTVFQTAFSISAKTDEVPGTGIALQNWKFGVDPLPTIPPPSSELNPGSTGRLMAPEYRNPLSEQFNVGYQWAVNNNSTIEVDYVHVLGLHENKTVNVNPVDPNSSTGARPLDDDFAAAGVPVLGSVRVEESVNRSRYDGVNFSFRRRMTRHFTLNANYTVSRAMGWGIQSGNPLVGSGFRNYPHDPRNLWDPRDFGPTPNDERHHVTVSDMVELPWGFDFAPILQFGTARPYDLNEGYDVLGIGSGYSRPLIVNNNDPKNLLAYADSALAQDALDCLAAAQCHQAGYDTVRGRAFFQLDTRIAKNIRLGEHRNLQLMFQAFNLTNKTNYGNNFVNTANSAKFLTPAGYINPTSSSTPRAFVGEFGARFTF